MQNIPVTAYVNDGKTVSGELMAEVPQEKARLSDCLNLTGKFLPVKSGMKMCYINKVGPFVFWLKRQFTVR